MARHRYPCQRCGRRFTADSTSLHAEKLTCKRAKCEKLSGIYGKTKEEQRSERDPICCKTCNLPLSYYKTHKSDLGGIPRKLPTGQDSEDSV